LVKLLAERKVVHWAAVLVVMMVVKKAARMAARMVDQLVDCWALHLVEYLADLKAD